MIEFCAKPKANAVRCYMYSHWGLETANGPTKDLSDSLGIGESNNWLYEKNNKQGQMKNADHTSRILRVRPILMTRIEPLNENQNGFVLVYQ